MEFGAGLSREERERKITSAKAFKVLPDSREAIYEQVMEFARLIHFYALSGEEDGHWDELLNELGRITDKDWKPDGNMEPSQALLYAFLMHYREVIRTFNCRWQDYPSWYLREIAGISPVNAIPEGVGLSFSKNVSENIYLEKGLPFMFRSKAGSRLLYRLSQELEVNSIRLSNVYAFRYERDRRTFPAGHLNYITAIRYRELLLNSTSRERMFREESRILKKQGLKISAPSFLLREGQRTVTLEFYSGDTTWIRLLEEEIDRLTVLLRNRSRERIVYQLFYNLFYLQVTTPEGWTSIPHYSCKQEDGKLLLHFILPGEFPEVCACTPDIHSCTTSFPVLGIYPNADAWLYPYSWLSRFHPEKIVIRTAVENLRNIQVYNELGRVDNSRPFSPFGNNTEQGAWFAVGSYEMAVKNVRSLDVQIGWDQLPELAGGLEEYYRGYGKKTGNDTFKVEGHYLADYNWHPLPGGNRLPLFYTIGSRGEEAVASIGKLSDKTHWRQLSVERMQPLRIPEEAYEYTLDSRAGYLNFVLEEPDTGFGEKYYRYLFARNMIESARTQKDPPVLRPPLSPVIERIRLSYRAEETIDLSRLVDNGDTFVSVCYPQGEFPLFRKAYGGAGPFFYTLETDAHLLFCFDRVKAGEMIHLYLEFASITHNCQPEAVPQVSWYWGNGYDWYPEDEQLLLEDTTQQLQVSGLLKIRVPEKIVPDHNGRVWLRAGIRENEENIPALLGAHLHVGWLKPEVGEWELQLPDIARRILSEGEWEAETGLPGISSFKAVTRVVVNYPEEQQQETQLRFSEWVTHRERAVTVRDYERMVLQHFPEIRKVKCIPSFDGFRPEAGEVTLAVITYPDSSSLTNVQPLAGSGLLVTIRNYLRRHIPASVKCLHVVNPDYLQLMVQCEVRFYPEYTAYLSRKDLIAVINHWIAPWQTRGEAPSFANVLSLETLYTQLKVRRYIREIKSLAVISFSAQQRPYKIHEYKNSKSKLIPSLPHQVFIPADEHLILTETAPGFGVGEMAVGQTFIISKYGTTKQADAQK